MTDKRASSYTVIDFLEDTDAAIITGLRISLFPYVGKDERLHHLVYATLLSGKKDIRQIAIQDMNINRSLAIVKSILTPSQMKAMDKKGYFGEARRAEMRQRILGSPYTNTAIKYAVNSWNFEENDLKDYVIGLLV
jgi:hypothetical protein